MRRTFNAPARSSALSVFFAAASSGLRAVTGHDAFFQRLGRCGERRSGSRAAAGQNLEPQPRISRAQVLARLAMLLDVGPRQRCSLIVERAMRSGRWCGAGFGLTQHLIDATGLADGRWRCPAAVAPGRGAMACRAFDLLGGMAAQGAGDGLAVAARVAVDTGQLGEVGQDRDPYGVLSADLRRCGL